jgi:acyl-CoA dehydrogenase
MATLDASRPLVASAALGGAQRALDCSVEYAKERKQFGVQRLHNIRRLQMMIADMATKVEASRLLTYKAAWMADCQGQRNTLNC